ncbi:cellulose synthase-like protein D2 [Zingiber officinale]|uniref:cellulose synthase-like protein D2 n=1 Tax=Zingiber officinale TaxID=94328 RepID=UPI001C4D75D3|nr:cellulose synthase-like protein D2 [Zingiber officinale]
MGLDCLAKFELLISSLMAFALPHFLNPVPNVLFLTRSQKMTRSLTSNWNGSRCLYETNGTYAYGNVIWPTETTVDGENVQSIKRIHKPWLLPLTRELKIPIAILILYRFLVFIRMVCLGLFLGWRIRHKNEDAIWLWGISTVCEFWFTFSWLLDQLPKLCPLDRATDLVVLKEKFETATFNNPTGKSDLPGIDVFVSTSNTKEKPSFVIANTILSILAADYPVEKLSCYVSDDGGSLLTFESIAEAVSFANIWVPFCRKHGIEPRNPESYFNLKRYSYKNRVHTDFVNDRRRVKREYHEFKVRINGLSKLISQRSDSYQLREEIKTMKQRIEVAGDDPVKRISKATWMANGTHWPGTWINPSSEHTEDDHAGVIQIMLKPPSDEPLFGNNEEDTPLDFTNIDTRLPLLVYVSRQKHPDYHHNEKAGAMNALVRASAIMSNGPFILSLDYDHCVYNSQALREGMCFMMDRGGDQLCYVQFPQCYRGCYANDNKIFFDVNMRALDGLQGPVCVGTGCLFRRIALYGFDPPRPKDHHIGCENHSSARTYEETKFGYLSFLIASIPVVELQGRSLADHPAVKYRRQPGILTSAPRELVDASTVAEALSVISCWYEDETEWGQRVGWIYGSVIGDTVTGYRMHNRGWKSVYCVTKPDAFRAIPPSNLAERLHQMFRWATGCVEIFFSRNNALLASSRMKILQRVAYLNVGIYPFTSIFLVVYCFLPAISLFTGQFIVPTLNVTFLTYLLLITLTLCLLSILETMWSGITFEEWWRNEQFWLIGGTSAHFGAVLQMFLKLIAGIVISFTPTWELEDDEDGEFSDTCLMILPITIMMANLIAIAVGISRTIHNTIPQWSKLLGGVSFSFWVLAHLYPVAKGLVEQRRRYLIMVWSGLLSITLLLSVWSFTLA